MYDHDKLVSCLQEGRGAEAREGMGQGMRIERARERKREG